MGWEADRARDHAESMSWAEQQAALQEAEEYERDRFEIEDANYDDGNGMTVGGYPYDKVEPIRTVTGRSVTQHPPLTQVMRPYSKSDAQLSLEAFVKAFGYPKGKKKMARKQELERRLAAILDQIERLNNRPEEPMKSVRVGENEVLPPTILFTKRFGHGAGAYSYAFVGINGRWYGTGPKAPKSFSWDELMDWLENTGPWPKIYLVQKSGVKLHWEPEAIDTNEEDNE